jgi:tetratricopeptide (TPR) repeat protein
VLVIVEDLQWAGSESLKVFHWLAQASRELPVLLLGSYRNDEAPGLRDQLPGVESLVLRRLAPEATQRLVECMIGEAARREDVVALLEHETEGIPFFIVEVVRALAEGAGGLGHIGVDRLPRRVLSGGMQKVIRRRLERVPKDALAGLRTAAILGRAIDLTLMHAMHPNLAAEGWLMRCAEAGVVEVRDEEWQFSHDKLREQLLDDLSPAAKRPLHRKVAEAIEAEYPGRDEYLTALAHHWQQAGEAAKEAEYAQRAGVLALQSGACQEAIVHLGRALELLQALGATTPATSVAAARPARRFALLDPNAKLDPDSPVFRLGMVEGWLSDAHFRLGDLAASGEHSERALRHFGQRLPTLKLGWGIDIVRQLTRGTVQALLGPRAVDAARSRRVANEVARVQNRFIESSVYSLRILPLLSASLRQVNHCRPAGPELELAQAYLILGAFAGLFIGPRLLDRWCRGALATVERAGSPRDVACILSRVASQELSRCRWDTADAYLARAIEAANDVGDLRLWAECHAQTGAVAHYSGRFERGLRLYADTYALSRRGGNHQIQCWALLGQADLLLRLGRTEEALALYEEGIQKLDGNAMRTEAIWGFGMAALTRLRLGDRVGAQDAADRAFSFIVRSSPIAYWTQQGMAATAEVLLTLYETTPRHDIQSRLRLRNSSRRVCATLRTFGRRYAMGRPHALLWSGLSAWLERQPRRAQRLWKRAIVSAEALRMPFEAARAHLEIGRRLPLAPEDRRYYLEQAAQRFAKMGAAFDLVQAREALERHVRT